MRTQSSGTANVNALITGSLWSMAQVSSLRAGHCVWQSLGIVSRSLCSMSECLGNCQQSVDRNRPSLHPQPSQMLLVGLWGEGCRCFASIFIRRRRLVSIVLPIGSGPQLGQHVPLGLPSVWNIYLCSFTCSWQSHLSALMQEWVRVPIQECRPWE